MYDMIVCRPVAKFHADFFPTDKPDEASTAMFIQAFVQIQMSSYHIGGVHFSLTVQTKLPRSGSIYPFVEVFCALWLDFDCWKQSCFMACL